MYTPINFSGVTVSLNKSREARDGSCIVPGAARLVRLDQPFPIGKGRGKRPKERTTRYIWVSTSTVMGDVETYAFAAYSNGKVFDWCELPGSQKGSRSHYRVLLNMGINLDRNFCGGLAPIL